MPRRFVSVYDVVAVATLVVTTASVKVKVLASLR